MSTTTRVVCYVLASFLFIYNDDVDSFMLQSSPPIEFLKAEIESYPGYQGSENAHGYFVFSDNSEGVNIIGHLYGLSYSTQMTGLYSIWNGNDCDSIGEPILTKSGNEIDWKLLVSNPCQHIMLPHHLVEDDKCIVNIETSVIDLDLSALDGLVILVDDPDGQHIGCGILESHAESCSIGRNHEEYDSNPCLYYKSNGYGYTCQIMDVLWGYDCSVAEACGLCEPQQLNCDDLWMYDQCTNWVLNTSFTCPYIENWGANCNHADYCGFCEHDMIEYTPTTTGIWVFIGSLAGVIVVIGFVPYIFKIIKEKAMEVERKLEEGISQSVRVIGETVETNVVNPALDVVQKGVEKVEETVKNKSS